LRYAGLCKPPGMIRIVGIAGLVVSLLSLVMALARTSPEEARSTLGKWLSEFRGYAKKPWALAILSVVFALSALAAFWPNQNRNDLHDLLASKITPGGNNLSTGPVSGGQVANNIVNNFYGASGFSTKEFSEDPSTPVTFSIGCMNFRPIGELLASINSGKPTPFLSAQRSDFADPIPLISLYMKEGAIWADIKLFSPQQKYGAFSLRGATFQKLAPNWDVNASARAIEVVDENGVPFFQLLRVSNMRLRIDGLFRTEERVLFLGRDDTNLKILSGADAKNYVPPPDFLPKLFRYPSREHARELIEPEPSRPPCARLSEGISAISAGIVIPL
jgi:hypothetical protein